MLYNVQLDFWIFLNELLRENSVPVCTSQSWNKLRSLVCCLWRIVGGRRSMVGAAKRVQPSSAAAAAGPLANRQLHTVAPQFSELPYTLSWKSNPNWCLICCILTYTDPQNLPNHTKPYQTKPNDLKLYVGIPNKVPSNFWPFLHVDLGPKLSVFI